MRKYFQHHGPQCGYFMTVTGYDEGILLESQASEDIV